MASTYSDLKIELIATGEQSGTWGTTTNNNLGNAALGEAITGSADVAFSSADVTVTLTDTNASQTARNLRLNLTGTSGGARNLILGSGCQIEKLYLINNGLADAVTVKNTSGTGIAVAAGKSMFVYNNGTNVVEAVTQYNGTIPLASGVTGVLPLANGGTASTSAPQALATLMGWTTTATSGGTTTLTNASSFQQEFTGTSTQTVVLPVTSTLALGWTYEINNSSTQNLSIQSSGLNAVGTLTPGTTAAFVVVSTSGTTAASWDFDINGFGSQTGSGAVVLNTSPSFTTAIDCGATFGAFASSTALTIASTATGASSTTNIATAALSGAFTKAINIGTGGTTSSTTTINMGSATNGSTIIRGSLAVGSVTANTTDGAIWASGNVTAFASSDIRFKENVRDIPNALEKVEIIGGKLFDWTAQYIESMGGEHSYFMHKSDAGVIAQDVEKVLPELVRTREDGSLAVDYPKLVALAFAAIKELSDKVKLLEGK
jgi:hypothetical protein